MFFWTGRRPVIIQRSWIKVYFLQQRFNSSSLVETKPDLSDKLSTFSTRCPRDGQGQGGREFISRQTFFLDDVSERYHPEMTKINDWGRCV